VLHEQLGDKRLRLNDEQRRRLVVKAKKVGQRVLREMTTIAAPQRLPYCDRNQIAMKDDGSRPNLAERMRTLCRRLS
jgi:hypothetical protein